EAGGQPGVAVQGQGRPDREGRRPALASAGRDPADIGGGVEGKDRRELGVAEAEGLVGDLLQNILGRQQRGKRPAYSGQLAENIPAADRRATVRRRVRRRSLAHGRAYLIATPRRRPESTADGAQ